MKHAVLAVAFAAALVTYPCVLPATADDGPVSGPATQSSAAPELPSGSDRSPILATALPGASATGDVLTAVPPELRPDAGGDVAFELVNPDGSGAIAYAHVPPADIALLAAPAGGYDAAPRLGRAATAVATSTAELPGSGTTSGCTYGTARGLTPIGCPPLHWERFTTTHAYMYIEDHTGSAWPVYAAQINWNKSCCVGAYYAGTACPSTFHCVKVTEGSFGATGWDGLTTYNWDSNHHFTTVKIQYNDSYSETYNQHWTDTCHEQGHALGLDHNTSTASCLYASGWNSHLPTSDDYSELQYKIYNH
jgi:hypothetical protein